MVDLIFHLSPLTPVPDRANAAIACLNNKRQPIHREGLLGSWCIEKLVYTYPNPIHANVIGALIVEPFRTKEAEIIL